MSNVKKLVDFIDDYANNYKIQSMQNGHKIDYSFLSTIINNNYINDRLYDHNFVGYHHKQHLTNKKTPQTGTHPKLYYYYYSHPELIQYNQQNTAQNSQYLYPYYHNYDYQTADNNTDMDNKNNKENKENIPPPDYYSYFSHSLWNDTTVDMYSTWQKEHDVTSTIIQNKNIIETKKLTHIVKTITKTKVIIDASMQTLGDIVSIVEKYDYSPDNEYNIDLKSLHNVKQELIELNNMIGMQSLKQSVLEQLVYFVQDLHLGENVSDFKHTVIYGPPGTGKTEIAKIVGKMYSKLGILKSNIFKKVTRSDLVAGYLGQTAIKTKKIVTETLGGVLFIDEAYSLASKEDNDIYSKECIDTLCELLSHHKNDLMVILAGYEDELNETIFRVNRGMESRFIWRFKIDEYSPVELMDIFKKKVREQEWNFEKEDEIKDNWFIEKKTSFKSYGRDMELLLLYVKIAHGRRIYGKPVELRKKISLYDLDNGYKTFLTNKNVKKIPEYLTNMYM